MLRVPLMVTSLKVDDPVVAVTLPVIPPVRLPVSVPLIAKLLKVDVPEEAVTLPATLPVRSPVKPLEAATVVPDIAVGFVDPITTPFIEPLLPAPPTVTEPRVEVVELSEARVLRPVTPRVPPIRALPARCRSLYFRLDEPISTVLVVDGVMLLEAIATISCHTAAEDVFEIQTNKRFAEVFIQILPGAYPATLSSVAIGLLVALRLFFPPMPPFIAGRYPETEVAKLIFGELPDPPS
jgi:hypothetical protein